MGYYNRASRNINFGALQESESLNLQRQYLNESNRFAMEMIGRQNQLDLQSISNRYGMLGGAVAGIGQAVAEGLGNYYKYQLAQQQMAMSQSMAAQQYQLQQSQLGMALEEHKLAVEEARMKMSEMQSNTAFTPLLSKAAISVGNGDFEAAQRDMTALGSAIDTWNSSGKALSGSVLDSLNKLSAQFGTLGISGAYGKASDLVSAANNPASPGFMNAIQQLAASGASENFRAPYADVMNMLSGWNPDHGDMLADRATTDLGRRLAAAVDSKQPDSKNDFLARWNYAGLFNRFAAGGDPAQADAKLTEAAGSMLQDMVTQNRLTPDDKIKYLQAAKLAVLLDVTGRGDSFPVVEGSQLGKSYAAFRRLRGAFDVGPQDQAGRDMYADKVKEKLAPLSVFVQNIENAKRNGWVEESESQQQRLVRGIAQLSQSGAVDFSKLPNSVVAALSGSVSAPGLRDELAKAVYPDMDYDKESISGKSTKPISAAVEALTYSLNSAGYSPAIRHYGLTLKNMPGTNRQVAEAVSTVAAKLGGLVVAGSHSGTPARAQAIQDVVNVAGGREDLNKLSRALGSFDLDSTWAAGVYAAFGFDPGIGKSRVLSASLSSDANTAAVGGPEVVRAFDVMRGAGSFPEKQMKDAVLQDTIMRLVKADPASYGVLAKYKDYVSKPSMGSATALDKLLEYAKDERLSSVDTGKLIETLVVRGFLVSPSRAYASGSSPLNQIGSTVSPAIPPAGPSPVVTPAVAPPGMPTGSVWNELKKH